MRQLVSAWIWLALVILVALPAVYAGEIWHVSVGGMSIQAALLSASTGDIIEIAPGTYHESAIIMDQHDTGVTLRGQSVDPRDVVIDAQSAGRVFLCKQLGNLTLIQAVTIAGGFAASGDLGGQGGGLLCLDCTGLRLDHCVIHGNQAQTAGGGLCCTSGGVQITSCTFVGNSAPSGGGAKLATAASLNLERSIIAASVAGGALQCADSAAALLTGCNIHGNTGGDWVGCIQDQAQQSGNFSAPALFWNETGGDYRLRSDSPCLPWNNAGGVRVGALPAVKLVVDPQPGAGDFTRIDQAVQAASDFMVIELAGADFSGTGNRDIDLGGKRVTIISRSDNPDSCVIDCQGSADQPHRGFWFHSREDATTVLRGLTIANGIVDATLIGGGGILCENGSSPRLLNLILQQNSADVGGGGMHCQGDSSPEIAGCSFQANRSSAGGGGVHCITNSSPQIVDSTFLANRSDAGGGGVHCIFNSSPQIKNTLFLANRSDAGGGGVHCETLSSPLISGCAFGANQSNTGAAGVHCLATCSAEISNCRFSKNVAPLAGCAYGAGGSSLLLSHSILVFSRGGRAVACDVSATVSLSCCNLFGNEGGDYVGCTAGQLGVNGNISVDPGPDLVPKITGGTGVSPGP